MLKEFRRYIAENNMLKSDSRVLLAVSGGIDSMVMAHLFGSSGIKSGIAHCNFSLRGNESDLDEDLVRKYADVNNLPYYSVRFNTKAFAAEKGLSIQMAARELRYKWFEEIRSLNGYDYIAIAHNLNDNIETLLLNLTRGTGITGLTGIRPVSNRIIRPLLFATRQDIEKYCKKQNISFREDSSNAETKYTRNRIRHLVIPVLKEINPAVEYTIGETIERLRDIDNILEKYISGLRNSITVVTGNSIAFSIEKLNSFIYDSTVLFELFRPFGISGSQTEDLVDVIMGTTGGQIYTTTHRILKDRENIVVFPNVEKTDVSFKIDNLDDLRKIPGIESAGFTDVTENFVIPVERNTACIDEEEIIFPLIIRRWRKGDYFCPLGMSNRKKLSDFFIDKKLSLIEKERIMVLESDGRIVWVMGERIDSRFRIKPSTKRALIIKLSV
jgi:tRNA(Ile)-lysidine synthase